MNYKSTLFFILLFSNAFLTIGQFSVKIVNENFNSNMMRWDVYSNEVSEMELADSKYTLNSKKEGTAITSTIEVPHLQLSNYRISTSLSKLNGIDDNGFGLVWGGKDENNELEFVISGNGQFKIMKWEQGVKTDLYKWTYSTAINKWDFSKNVLKIESLNNVLKFYINDIYVAAIQDIPQLGNRVGFVLNEVMQIKADYLLVENLTSEMPENLGTTNNIEISRVEFAGNKSSNEIYYNETAYINVELINHGNLPVKDLAVKVKVLETITGLEYNPVTMVEQIAGNERKTIAIKLSTDEEIPNQNINFNIKLSGVRNEIIDAKNLNIKTIGLSSYYANNETNKTNSNIDSYNNNSTTKKSNNSTETCTKGCSGIGLLALLTGLIFAIIP